MTIRGGPQFIPRPAAAEPGPPAPWSEIPADERVISIERVRAAFAGRGHGRPSAAEAPGVRASAVLAAFYEQQGQARILFTRRAWHLRAHRGEVSFPGGAVDRDETPVDAARREAKEEIGLDPSTVEIIGELDHLTTITSRSFIVPYVAVLDAPPVGLTPNPSEVAAVLHVPVDELLRDDVFRAERWPWPSGGMRAIYFFELVGDTLWGATAAMVRQLLAWCLGVEVGIDHH